MADPHNHTHQQRRHTRLGILAALAMTAALLTAGTAAAEEIKTGEDNKAQASAKADFTACLGPAVEDHGFTDLEGLDDAGDDINCLAYYGITTGRTATTFDPDSNVTRGQMALFLYRAAKAAGIDLMGGDMDAMYGDIDELSEERQAAIKALARNGILTGRNTMSFYPLEEITRAEMAIALVNLTKHAAPHRFHQSGTLKGSLIIDSDDMDHFADARRTVPRAVDTHISYAYELGITTGYPNGSSGSREFRPSESVPRRNMASFITRALAHSNLRPQGLTAQSNNGTITVSIRDDNFQPDPNESVDVFYVNSDREARAFNNDGECRSIVSSVDVGDECEIDRLDPATNADGNAQLEPLKNTHIGDGVTVWAWTGEFGDEVDEDTDLYEFDQGPVTQPVAAGSSSISPAQAKTPMARFGESVEFSVQLQYTDIRGTPDDADDVKRDTSVGTDGESPAQFSLTVAVYTGQITTLADDGTRTFPEGAGGLVSQSASQTLKTNADGKATFSVTTTDPDPRAESEDDYRTVIWTLTDAKNTPDVENDPAQQRRGYVIFAEDSSAVTVLRAEAFSSYATAPTAGRSASNGVSVTVLDQYHRPMRGQAVTLTSSANTDSTQDSKLPASRHTASTGNVRIGYSHTGTTPSVETITAIWNGDAAGDDDSGCYDAQTNDDGKDRCAKVQILWAERTDDEASTQAHEIVDGSLDDDEIVVDTDGAVGDDGSVGEAATPWVLRYDSNDILVLNANYVDIDDFETALSKVLDPDNPDPKTDRGTLQWDSYDHDDEDDRTLFTLTTS